MRLCTFLILAALGLSSCVSTRFATKDFQPAAPPAIALVPPVALIAVVEQGNKGHYDRALSRQGRELMQQALLKYQAELHLNGEVAAPDSLTQQRLTAQMYRTINIIEKRQKLDDTYELPTLDSLLRQQGQRYALLTATRGFTRVAGNYGPQVAKAVGVGILTLGMYSPVPIKATSSMFLFIYDAETHAVVYYNHAAPREAEPLDAAVLDRQLRSLLAKDFRFPARP